MAYSEELAQRVRTYLGGHPLIEEKRMFGGVGFLLQGNMACGINKDDLIVRVGPENYEQALEQPHARPFDMTGRPMSGWVMVNPAGYASQEDLGMWVTQGLDFAASLPPK